MTKESLARSFFKTISWRIVVLILDFLIAYFFTKDLELASKLALAKFVIASILYFGHERFWNVVSWGRN